MQQEKGNIRTDSATKYRIEKKILRRLETYILFVKYHNTLRIGSKGYIENTERDLNKCIKIMNSVDDLQRLRHLSRLPINKCYHIIMTSTIEMMFKKLDILECIESYIVDANVGSYSKKRLMRGYWREMYSLNKYHCEYDKLSRILHKYYLEPLYKNNGRN